MRDLRPLVADKFAWALAWATYTFPKERLRKLIERVRESTRIRNSAWPFNTGLSPGVIVAIMGSMRSELCMNEEQRAAYRHAQCVFMSCDFEHTKALDFAFDRLARHFPLEAISLI